MLWFLTKPVPGKDSFQCVQMLIYCQVHTYHMLCFLPSLNSTGLRKNYHKTYLPQRKKPPPLLQWEDATLVPMRTHRRRLQFNPFPSLCKFSPLLSSTLRIVQQSTSRSFIVMYDNYFRCDLCPRP